MESNVNKYKHLPFDDLKNYLHSLFTSDLNFNELIHQVIELLGITLFADTVYFDSYEPLTRVNNFEWNRTKKFRFSKILRYSLPFLYSETEHNGFTDEIKKFLKLYQIKKLFIYPIKIKDQIVASFGIVYRKNFNKIDEKKLELATLFEIELNNYYTQQKTKNLYYDLSFYHKKFMNNFIYPIVILDKEYKILEVNSKFETEFNYVFNDIQKRDFIELYSAYDREKMEKVFNDTFENVQEDIEVFKLVQNEKKIYRLTPFPIKTDELEIIGIVIKDITKYKVAESKLKKMAFFDSTTGLHNRNYFDQICEDISNHTYHSIGVIVLDIDNLKVINDRYGHEAGDNLIIDISRILYEVFNEEFLVARIGGDEFTVFILNRTDEEIRNQIDAFNNKINLHNRYNEVQLCLSIGYDFKEGKTDCILDLINKADENMYLHKKRKNKTNV